MAFPLYSTETEKHLSKNKAELPSGINCRQKYARQPSHVKSVRALTLV
jgi:hypothetical protein